MVRISKFASLFILAGACSTIAAAAEGKLMVTATVVTSVAVVMDANSGPKIVVANAPDPADNVSVLAFQKLLDGKRSTPNATEINRVLNPKVTPGAHHHKRQN